MNTKQTEALKLAQEALKELRMLGMNMQWHDSWLAKSETAITAIREALAEQPAQQQEPKLPEFYARFEDGLVSVYQRREDATPLLLLRENLPDKQPAQQEPVAWSYWQSCLNDDGTQTAPWVHRLSKFKPNESIINKDIIPLYTIPPHRKPLKDEEFQKICTRLSRQGGWDGDGWDLALKEAIEAAHGIKGEA